MPIQPQEFVTFKGLLPAFDRKRIVEPFVVDGENFIVDADGPVSFFGRTWWTYGSIAEPRGFQALLSIDQETYYYTAADALCRYDETTRQMYPVFTHATRTLFWPWTIAIVGGYEYFVNREVGLVRHDPVDGTWNVLVDANIPNPAIACCEAYGRLVVLGDTHYSWSAIDDGSIAGFVPSTATGAGFQLLSILGSGLTGLMLLAYQEGFVVYTTAGLIRVENVQAENPFRHRILTRATRPLNPWVITRISGSKSRYAEKGDTDELQLYLAHRGLYITDGTGRPRLWNEALSEYLLRTLLPALDHDGLAFTTRLHYNNDLALVFLSVSDTGQQHTYSRAYAVYTPLDEIGILSRAHTALYDLSFMEGAIQGPQFGMIDAAGTQFYFSFTDTDRLQPTAGAVLVDYRAIFDIPTIAAEDLADINIVADQIVMSDEDLSLIPRPGVFDIEYPLATYPSPSTFAVATEVAINTSATPHIASDVIAGNAEHVVIVISTRFYDEAPLDARILIGLLRRGEIQSIDVLSGFETGIISMLDAGIADTFEDYISDYMANLFEDYADSDDIEDWGVASSSGTEYTARMIGTLDGYQTWMANDTVQDVVLNIVGQDGRNRFVSGTVIGLYLLLEISAFNVGESFHLKTLRINMGQAGRLN